MSRRLSAPTRTATAGRRSDTLSSSRFALNLAARGYYYAGLPSSVRLCFGQPCSPTRNGRFARPCDRSTYTYMSSGRSPARLVSFSQVPLRCGPKQSRAWHLWSSSSRSVAPRPRSRSPRRLSRRLHGVTRRHASSAEYRLLALRRVPPRIRRTGPLRVAQLATRHAAPLPHYMLNPLQTIPTVP